MKIGKVLGNVVATVKTDSHRGLKLMVVQTLDERGEPHADPLIAVDCAHAGIGDIVLIVEEGGSAREVMQRPDGAVDAVIVGIIDYLNELKER
ncbi:EutN/CcmL family microcompartment protein [Paenibacillus athensensis]|uniref:Ethanolamine utilization protein EutN n=1 Tax=Paenibacillus athensensis TaxID=1967502 RepID=A0A4Y8PYZ7_9BACL|nr:EutN/CcmL family microcompartment protein [Paenibacillus athensensis]MCD1260464.1 EutN/CcmL family microcompartment protein [Paenibacillus athensensis]